MCLWVFRRNVVFAQMTSLLLQPELLRRCSFYVIGHHQFSRSNVDLVEFLWLGSFDVTDIQTERLGMLADLVHYLRIIDFIDSLFSENELMTVKTYFAK